jgi:hypothetical protein
MAMPLDSAMQCNGAFSDLNHEVFLMMALIAFARLLGRAHTNAQALAHFCILLSLKASGNAAEYLVEEQNERRWL